MKKDPLEQRGIQAIMQIDLVLRYFQVQREEAVTQEEILEALSNNDVNFFSENDLNRLAVLIPTSPSGDLKFPKEETDYKEIRANPDWLKSISYQSAFICALYSVGGPHRRIRAYSHIKEIPSLLSSISSLLPSLFSVLIYLFKLF